MARVVSYLTRCARIDRDMLKLAIVLVGSVVAMGCAVEPGEIRGRERDAQVESVGIAQEDSIWGMLCEGGWGLVAGMGCGAVDLLCDTSEVVTVGETEIP